LTPRAAQAPAQPGSALESRKPSRCTDQEREWAQLTSSDQQLWATLGWTRARWDSGKPGKAPASESKSWSELSKTERRAASQLGFNEKNWDVDCRLNPQSQKIETKFDPDDS
jgi:hypothetical protein